MILKTCFGMEKMIISTFQICFVPICLISINLQIKKKHDHR